MCSFSFCTQVLEKRKTKLNVMKDSASVEVQHLDIHSYFYYCLNCGTPVCRDGNVSLQEYMAFMISRETENVKSSEEIESAFRALSTENKPYVTKEELYQVRCVHCSLCCINRNSLRSHRSLLLFRI